MDKLSVANTTREERLAIVLKSLSCGSEGSCEFCSGCGVFGSGSVMRMYQPYIDGEMELAEVNMRFRAPFNIK
ncbi:MAG: hypothetical protein PQJ58_00980 [Spirochaetales bacterium]|nr:hypothetical protein [Spirochaetales bacterium]